MAQGQFGPKIDFAVRLTKMQAAIDALSTRDVLRNASIGAGGLLVNGSGGITVTGGGSITITGTGTLNVAAGGLNSAGSITAATFITAGTSITAGTGFSTPGSISASGALSVGSGSVGGNLTVSGQIFIPNGFAAVSGYTVAYINGDGRLSVGASAARFKQDFEPVYIDPLADAIFRATLVRFRLIAAVEEFGDDAVLEIGLLADYLETIGLAEFVYRDAEGAPLGIQYERLTVPLIAAVQNLDARLRAAGL